MKEEIKSHYLLFILLFLSAGLFFFYLRIQPQVSHTYSPLFDANKYVSVYAFFSGTITDYQVPFPIHSRILIPWLASLMPFETASADFLAVNFIFMLLSVIAIHSLWRAYRIPQEYIMAGFFWLLIHWVGIIRLNIFDPITVDVPLYFFHALLLLILLKKKYYWLLLLGPVATLQKESFIALLAGLFILQVYLTGKEKLPYHSIIWIFLALIASAVTKGIVNNWFPPVDEGRSSLIILLFHARETLLDPFRLIRWITAVFMAFGPLFLLAIWFKGKNRKLSSGDPVLIGLGLVHLGLSLLAGGDFTRLAFLGFPFIMTWILVSLTGIKSFFFKAGIIFGIPLMKGLSDIPDPAITGWEKFNNFYPEFANPVIVMLWMGYGALCLLVYHTIDKKLAKMP